MTEVRADRLQVGDQVRVKGRRWTVAQLEAVGKQVTVTLQGEDGQRFPGVVKGKALFDRVGARVYDQRTSPVGAGAGSDPRAVKPVLTEPDPAPSSTVSWEKAAGLDEPVVKVLGARLVGVEDAGGRLVVPPVNDSTILGHLLTMHGVTYSGATIGEAKVWARTHSPGEDLDRVLTGLDVVKAYEVHAAQHENFASLSKPHWHELRAPR